MRRSPAGKFCLLPANWHVLDYVWNVMAHAQKPDFVFRRNGRDHSNWRGSQFSRLLAVEVCAISGSNAGYTMFRGSGKGTGYPLHSTNSPFTSPPVRQRVPSHFNRTLQHISVRCFTCNGAGIHFLPGHKDNCSFRGKWFAESILCCFRKSYIFTEWLIILSFATSAATRYTVNFCVTVWGQ